MSRVDTIARMAANARDTDVRLGRVLEPTDDYVADAIALYQEVELQVAEAYRTTSTPLPECPIDYPAHINCGMPSCPKHGV